jgi:hypothetical protein
MAGGVNGRVDRGPVRIFGGGVVLMFGIGPLELLIVAVIGGLCVLGVAAMILVILFAVKHTNGAPPPVTTRGDGKPKGEEPPMRNPNDQTL